MSDRLCVMGNFILHSLESSFKNKKGKDSSCYPFPFYLLFLLIFNPLIITSSTISPILYFVLEFDESPLRSDFHCVPISPSHKNHPFPYTIGKVGRYGLLKSTTSFTSLGTITKFPFSSKHCIKGSSFGL